MPIYTTGEDKGIHYYAMELIDGPSLDAVIRSLRGILTIQWKNAHVSLAEMPKWVKETVLFQGPGGDRGRVAVPGKEQRFHRSISAINDFQRQRLTSIRLRQ